MELTIKKYLNLILWIIYIEKGEKYIKKHVDFSYNCVDRFSDALPPHGDLPSVDQ